MLCCVVLSFLQVWCVEFKRSLCVLEERREKRGGDRMGDNVSNCVLLASLYALFTFALHSYR
jgi:hypothetical protein